MLVKLRERMDGIALSFAAKASDVDVLVRTWNDNNDNAIWEEQDMHGMSGARVRRIPGMGDGGDRGATATTTTTPRRVDCIPPH